MTRNYEAPTGTPDCEHPHHYHAWDNAGTYTPLCEPCTGTPEIRYMARMELLDGTPVRGDRWASS